MVVEGQISNIVDFGAFVDLDGIDGLIHISELSWSHVNHPSQILDIGQTVKVKVLDIDRDRQRISLGLKQTQEDPWQRIVSTYSLGDELEGTVTKVVTFGAFVEILDGVEGLVHISELAPHHVESPREIVHPGDEIRVKILEIDSERRRLSLSAKRVEDQILPLHPIELSPEDEIGDGEAETEVDPGAPQAAAAIAEPETEAPAEEPQAGGLPSRWPPSRRSLSRSPRPRSRRPRSPSRSPPPRSRRRRLPSKRLRPRSPLSRRPPPRSPRRRASRWRRRAPTTPSPSRQAPTTRPQATPDARPPFIGLTGSIGAGRSTALAAFERLGAAVLDADAIIHGLYLTEAVKTALHLHWGDRIFTPAQEVDRSAIAAIVFNSEDQRAWLEGLLWPLAAQRQAAFRNELDARTPRPRAGVVEVPLLFEAGAGSRFDVTIAILANDTLRATRLALRDQAELDARERRQLSQDEKATRATYRVLNEGTPEELERKLAEILDTLAA